jgi:hypothetical protein
MILSGVVQSRSAVLRTGSSVGSTPCLRQGKAGYYHAPPAPHPDSQLWNLFLKLEFFNNLCGQGTE